MVYIVQSTEKNNSKASEYETKGMLYLMCEHSNANEMFYFVIDFFNDVTSVHRMGHKAWDLQSKGESKLTATKIGNYLVTLYKNYLSDLHFSSFILFVAGISPTHLIDKSINVFCIDNFNENHKKIILESLKSKAYNVSYIDNSKISDNNLQDFISKVTFVINNKEKHEYIKNIIQNNSSLIVDDNFLTKIFNEIRDAQSVKKNIATEGMKVNNLEDFVSTGKYITNNDIILMILSRLIHKDNIDKQGAPICFIQYLNSLCETEDKISELINDCQNDIHRMLFDKNNATNYWELFFDIYKIIKDNPSLSVLDIYTILGPEKFSKVQHLNFNSAKYFIALIKDGIKNDHK